MVQSLLYPANPVKHFWENVMFESISLVSYNVVAPKPYVAPTSNSTDPLGLERGAVEYLASCLSKLKMKESAKPPYSLPKYEHSFFKNWFRALITPPIQLNIFGQMLCLNPSV
ncbi:hypothetical protein O181_120800 [Austropuccinia psidii MF-1]|uniref:Uncharacterized protein n=1 Tax=Austropuccinia psidii MF-1 TaxID=1389203 RepID=A0A9Q3KGF5_9BASI|nr:hypothetical protein [Austropuccinia psidii MF-1]